MGGTKVEAPQPPPPSPQETALQTEQLQLLKEQRAESAAFKPYLLESMGMRDVGGGKLEKIPWEERYAQMTPQERAGQELADLYLQRQKQALQGELPVSPALESELERQKQELTTNLSQRLGPNWTQSTPGIQSLNEFEKRAGLLREEARRGQISTGEGLIGARMGLLQGTQAQQYTQGQNWGANVYPLLSSYGSALAPFQQQRQFQQGLEFEAKQQTAANRMGLISGAMGLIGTGVGAWATGGLSLAMPKK